MPPNISDKNNLKSPRKDKTIKVKVKQKNITDNITPILKRDKSNVNINMKKQKYNEILIKNKIESEEYKFNQNWDRHKNIQIRNNELKQKQKSQDNQIHKPNIVNNFLQYEKRKAFSNEFDGNGKTPFYYGQNIHIIYLPKIY